MIQHTVSTWACRVKLKLSWSSENQSQGHTATVLGFRDSMYAATFCAHMHSRVMCLVVSACICMCVYVAKNQPV